MRYAILFSGMTQRRNLNGLEFCYRILVERFGFQPDCIYVLNYNGTLQTTDDPPNEDADHLVWPGDGTPHRIRITGQGSRAAFREVLQTLREKMTEDDLLFINTTGHGGNYGDGRGSYLVTYPRRDRFWATDFCSDLTELPAHRSLVVLMAQCFSADFTQAVVRSSRARRTYIASASSRSSYAMAHDPNWDAFERNWLAALAQRDVDGMIISQAANTAGQRNVSVAEAFHYAANGPNRHVRDLPIFTAEPESAGEITLREESVAELAG